MPVPHFWHLTEFGFTPHADFGIIWVMSTDIPSSVDVRARLARLNLAQLTELAERSGVPRPTIHKIKYGQTTNPGIETVRQFIGHIDAVTTAAASPAAAEQLDDLAQAEIHEDDTGRDEGEQQ